MNLSQDDQAMKEGKPRSLYLGRLCGDNFGGSWNIGYFLAFRE